MIWRILRSVARVPRPVLSPSHALAIARAECERRGYPWVEPIHIADGLRDFLVRTDADSIGGTSLSESTTRQVQ